jgi:hypothetical protein
MTHLTWLLLALPLVAGADPQETKKPAPAAEVVITAELACLHCNFGQGDGCAACLKLDDKTPVVLAGKAAQQFHDQRFSKKTVVAVGTLTLNKDKRLLLTSADTHLFDEKEKGKVPEKAQVQVKGVQCCGHCDLDLCEDCTVAIKNTTFPVVLDGKLAKQHAAEGKQVKIIVATGKLFIDKRGLVRLDAVKLETPSLEADKK